METYERLEIEVILLDGSDVILTSVTDKNEDNENDEEDI